MTESNRLPDHPLRDLAFTIMSQRFYHNDKEGFEAMERQLVEPPFWWGQLKEAAAAYHSLRAGIFEVTLLDEDECELFIEVGSSLGFELSIDELNDVQRGVAQPGPVFLARLINNLLNSTPTQLIGWLLGEASENRTSHPQLVAARWGLRNARGVSDSLSHDISNEFPALEILRWVLGMTAREAGWEAEEDGQWALKPGSFWLAAERFERRHDRDPEGVWNVLCRSADAERNINGWVGDEPGLPIIEDPVIPARDPPIMGWRQPQPSPDGPHHGFS